MQKTKNSMKMNKMAIFLIILIIWAVFSIVFIARNYWQDFKVGQIQAAINQGYNQGYGQAVFEIANVAQECQSGTIPLNLGNDENGNPVSLDIFVYAADCLKQNNDQSAVKEEIKEE